MAVITHTPPRWTLTGTVLVACNCDYGCPCEFAAPPTPGFCHGIGVWKIQRGKYDDLSLDGLGLAFAATWPKAIHEGNSTVCLFIDEKASPAQREALLAIGSGQAGPDELCDLFRVHVFSYPARFAPPNAGIASTPLK